QAQQARKTSTRIPLDVALLVLAVVLVGVYALHRVTREATDSETAGGPLLGVVEKSPPPVAAPPLPAAPAQPRQELADSPALQRAPPPPLPPMQTPAPETARPDTPPTASPEPTPTPFDERAQVRAAGLAAYEAALQRLAGLASQLDSHLRVHSRECGEGPKFSGGVSNCTEIEDMVR